MEIREMRARLGDTQSEFASRYNIPFRTIQNWETGARKPSEYILNLLEKQVKELKEEVEFLKKARAYFTRDHRKDML